MLVGSIGIPLNFFEKQFVNIYHNYKYMRSLAQQLCF